MHKVINNASRLFELSLDAAEGLANSAGLTLSPVCGNISEFLNVNYEGKIKDICKRALISEKMMQYYKKVIPTKQALLAIGVSLNFDLNEMSILLRSYGYCLSKSCVTDTVIIWFMENNSYKNGGRLLAEINNVLDDMGLPLLMTRQI